MAFNYFPFFLEKHHLFRGYKLILRLDGYTKGYKPTKRRYWTNFYLSLM